MGHRPDERYHLHDDHVSKVAFQTAATNNNAAAGVTGPTICDPLSGGTSITSLNNGLLGTMHYLTTDQLNPVSPAIFDSSQFSTFAQVFGGALGNYNGNIFLSSVNVPTRYFDNGFTDSSNNELLQADGSPVVQYFAMKLKSNLVQGTLPAGAYQLATISDDGSILTVTGGNTTQTKATDLVASFDGFHSASMACAPQPIQLNSSSSYPMELDYFQGPPRSIAMMVLYRPLPSTGNTIDPFCGVSQSDAYFFDDNYTPPKQQSTYTALLSRGWLPLPSTNYVLQNNVVNPCQ